MGKLLSEKDKGILTSSVKKKKKELNICQELKEDTTS